MFLSSLILNNMHCCDLLMCKVLPQQWKSMAQNNNILAIQIILLGFGLPIRCVAYIKFTISADISSSPLNDPTLKSIYVYSSSGLLPEFDSVDKTNPNCVVIGDAAEKFTYQNLNEAFRVLIGLEKPVLFSLGGG